MRTKKVLALVLAALTLLGVAGSALAAPKPVVLGSGINVGGTTITGGSSSGSSSSTQTQTTRTGTIVNCSSWVSMRKSASSSSSRIAKLNKGVSVTILDASGSYYKISYDGKEGYVSSQYVQLSSGSGYVQFYTPNASKISRGSAVYGISATENADTSGISADAATRTSLRSSLARFSSDYDSSSFSGIYQLKTELSAKLLAAAAENGDSSSQTIFYADQDGVVVYGSDGYESYTEDSLTPELFSTKASVVSFDSGAQTEPGNAVYRLVTDEQWEIAVPVTNKQVVTLSNFSTIKVKFLKDGKTQTGTLNLKSINDQNYAVISFTSGMIRYAEDRFLSVELVRNTGSGLKIPNTAITEKDFYKIPAQMLVQGGDSNSSGFLREKTDKKGNVMLDDNGQPVTEFVNATIYEQVNDENDNPVEYYVDMAAFNDGDILRAQDSATTYQIGEMVPLQGVYCINKGYAVFRKIQIIDQNAEYSIIKKQTQYGISQYDYIVENASTVSEEDIVH